MTDRKLATRYARALLAVVPDAPGQQAASRILDALAAALAGDPEIKRALVDPAVPSATKTKLLVGLVEASGGPSQIAGFLTTVVANGRVAALPAMAEAFREEHERAQGIVSGTLTTATPIPPELAERAAAALTRLSGRRVRLDVKVDPALVGGAVAQVGSTVYDGSMRTQLGRLERRIAKE